MSRFSCTTLALMTAIFSIATAQSRAPKVFTVTEEIQLAHFGDPYGDDAKAAEFSPDGNFVAALIERGRIDLDRPEDTIEIFRVADIRGFLRDATESQRPTPVWAFTRSSDKDGPLITHWRWLADSNSIAFLERGAFGRNRLVLADLRTQRIEPLSPEGWNINAYDIRDRDHFV